ncbi:Alcohol sulfotransferase [Rippkaea orientalis PCC 8801]|uniref:Alcohol sulfotransferase n=2 Tax=Rippkaea TaxID=2546365 RepID=B7K037_RIPO1|nr:Alcohol sulfotransferase [Rippkaea orientalis PCC 8801]
MPLGFPPEGFICGLNYQAQPSDIFIATYPKCGTTWTQYIVWLIHHQGEPLLDSQKIGDVSPHLEEVGQEMIMNLPQPRIIKTHLPYHLTPYHPQAKYIYVARNPFDCVVSFYHHTRGFIKHYDFAEGTFDDFFECFIRGEVDFGDYFENLVPWYQHKDNDNVLFLTYEAMKENLDKAIIKIAKFLGSDCYKDIQNPEILHKVMKYSSFESMSQAQQRWSSQRPKNMPPFIRHGKIGDWKNYFSTEQTQRLRDKFRICTAGTDLNQLWRDFLV